MAKVKIATVDGKELFVEAGTDEVSWLLDTMKSRIASLKVKPGDRFVIPIAPSGGKPLVVELTVRER